MSPYTRRAFAQELGFSADFHRVREFLLRIHTDRNKTPFFPWAAWEWMFCLPYLTLEDLEEISIWELDGEIVGLTTIEDDPGSLYFEADPAHPALKLVMLAHGLARYKGDEPLEVCIGDADPDFQRTARRLGFTPTSKIENASVLDLTGDLAYTLPEGYRIIDHSSNFDLYKFNRCLWRGFDREGEVDYGEARMEMRRRQLSGPHQDPELCVMVVAPDGEYVSYCGIWHEPGTHYAYVEPVCTDATFRKLGLGKAVVLEAARRCAARGATEAIVISAQEFYYRIGFNPVPAERWWRAP